MTCPSRVNMFFAGWDKTLEPPVGRPIASWDDIAPRNGRSTAEEIKKESEMARSGSQPCGVFDSGSSVAGSPRTGTTPTPSVQVRTYQDVTGDPPLGSLRKLPGCWLVYRKDVGGDWCLLCGKEAGLEHMGGTKHTKKLQYMDHNLNAWKYPFIDWLRDDPTSAPTTGTTTGPRTEQSAPNPGEQVVGDDGTFTWKNLGVLKVLPKQPCWIVYRKETGDNWCLLCDITAETWNGHLEGKKHLSKANNAKEWIPYLGLDFLCKSDSKETEEELKEARTSASSSSSACAAVTRPLALTSSSPSAAKTALWSATPEYPRECKMAETHGDAEPIHKITVRTVRIKIDRGDMPVNAVWLAVGRPGYLVFKADNEGQPMDWLDPFCLLCGAHASVDHIAATKHIEKTKEPTDWLKMRDYGEVLDWIQKDAQEVIHVASSSPKTKPQAPSEASSSDDDVPAPGAGGRPGGTKSGPAARELLAQSGIRPRGQGTPPWELVTGLAPLPRWLSCLAGHVLAGICIDHFASLLLWLIIRTRLLLSRRTWQANLGGKFRYALFHGGFL